MGIETIETEFLYALPLEAVDIEATPFEATVAYLGTMFEINEDATDGNDTLIGTDPVRDIIFGGMGDDTIEGRDSGDILLGAADNDKIRGEGGIDVIFDGSGDDRVFGGDGDDIIVFEGGGLDRASGGEGYDLFKLFPGMDDDGFADTVKIIDFDPWEDAIDLSGAEIASVTELNNRVQITLEGDGDVIDVKGVNDIDDILFVEPSIEELLFQVLDGISVDDGDDDDDDDHGGGDDGDDGDDGVDGGDGGDPFDDINEIIVRNGERKVFGTEGDDDIIFNGGELTRAFGNGGSDFFIFEGGVTDNGVVDTLKVLDFDATDDALGVFRKEVNQVTELNNRVILKVGEDNDIVELKGVNDFADIVFVEDFLLIGGDDDWALTT